jgi:hypothetical protein
LKGRFASLYIQIIANRRTVRILRGTLRSLGIQSVLCPEVVT